MVGRYNDSSRHSPPRSILSIKIIKFPLNFSYRLTIYLYGYYCGYVIISMDLAPWAIFPQPREIFLQKRKKTPSFRKWFLKKRKRDLK